VTLRVSNAIVAIHATRSISAEACNHPHFLLFLQSLSLAPALSLADARLDFSFNVSAGSFVDHMGHTSANFGENVCGFRGKNIGKFRIFSPILVKRSTDDDIPSHNARSPIWQSFRQITMDEKTIVYRLGESFPALGGSIGDYLVEAVNTT